MPDEEQEQEQNRVETFMERAVQVQNNPSGPVDRITMNIAIYHQQPGEEAVGMAGTHSYAVPADDEEPYRRKIKLTEEWEQVDFGWLEGRVGLLVIHNKREITQTTPTEETPAEANQCVELRLRGSKADILVPLGFILPICMVDPGKLAARVKSGTKKIEILVIPK